MICERAQVTAQPATQESFTHLWHYSSVDSIMSILKSKVIWGTRGWYLNDATESQLVVDEALKLLASRRETEAAGSRALLDVIATFMKGPHARNFFIASFSERGDDLSQWRGYSKGGGLALGLPLSLLEAVQVARLQQCVYYNPDVRSTAGIVHERTELFGRILDGELRRAAAGGGGEHADAARGLSASYAMREFFWRDVPTVKHDAFQDEREWRLIGEGTASGFRNRGNLQIPYLEIPLTASEDDWPHGGRPEDSIRVMIGPNNNRGAVYDSICSRVNCILPGADVDAIVSLSRVPYVTE